MAIVNASTYAILVPTNPGGTLHVDLDPGNFRGKAISATAHFPPDLTTTPNLEKAVTVTGTEVYARLGYRLGESIYWTDGKEELVRFHISNSGQKAWSQLSVTVAIAES
ncbi:hypothetical protein ACFVXW_05275 [Streptomyces sp. NPDC058251]|uniref:hypothetical protein n=1 Tax=unclassified Streptomyces TaxID=2593676 RepID=UPI00364FA214